MHGVPPAAYRSQGSAPTGDDVAVAETDGEADADADADGDAEVGADVGVLLETAPVHVVPFRLKEVGTGLDPVQAPLNPKLVLPPVGIDPLYDRLETVTFAPDWV
jgi:hypothetical protein